LRLKDKLISIWLPLVLWIGGCCGGQGPAPGYDGYDPSTDTPVRFEYEQSGVDFEDLSTWHAENDSSWPSHAESIKRVATPDYSVDGLALKLTFTDLGKCEGSGCKTEAAWCYQDVPMNFSGMTRVSMVLTYDSEEPISMKLSLSTGDNWDWCDFPKPPATISGFVRQLVNFEIPPTILKMEDNKRFCIVLDKSGAPYVSGVLYIDQLRFE
jgi:hypothetical protein